VISVIFFFQAEDGIRDTSVTGVQTCALPISENKKVGSVILFPNSLSHEIAEGYHEIFYHCDLPRDCE